jgi:hypothetical protein
LVAELEQHWSQVLSESLELLHGIAQEIWGAYLQRPSLD